eukprot:s180_g23.t1
MAAVLTFTGAGAPAMRRQHLLTACPGVTIEHENDTADWLHFAVAYKHLGNMFAASPVASDIIMCSRMFFGMGTWTTPTIRQLGRLRAAFMRMLYEAWFVEMLMSFYRNYQKLFDLTGMIDLRIWIAIDRLLYAHKLFKEGPAHLQQLLHLEHQFCGNSWIEGLSADLQWLQRVVPQGLPFHVIPTGRPSSTCGRRTPFLGRVCSSAP